MSLPSTGTRTTYSGTYRGLVVNNLDPLQLNRVLVQVPALSAHFQSEWAFPVITSAGSAVPAVFAQVDIQFEGGDLHLPLWSAQDQSVTAGLNTASFHRLARSKLLYPNRTFTP